MKRIGCYTSERKTSYFHNSIKYFVYTCIVIFAFFLILHYYIHQPTLNIHQPTLNIHPPTLNIHQPTLNIHPPTLNIHPLNCKLSYVINERNRIQIIKYPINYNSYKKIEKLKIQKRLIKYLKKVHQSYDH